MAWTPDSKKVVYQAQNREQTFLDVNFADARDGKSTNIIHETSKAWVAINENPIWLKDGSFLWASERRWLGTSLSLFSGRKTAAAGD